MKAFFQQSIVIGSLAGSTAALAHAGDHTPGGFLALVAHLLGEHGYLAVVLLLTLGAARLLRSRYF
jgi:hypothetical protein